MSLGVNFGAGPTLEGGDDPLAKISFFNPHDLAPANNLSVQSTSVSIDTENKEIGPQEVSYILNQALANIGITLPDGIKYGFTDSEEVCGTAARACILPGDSGQEYKLVFRRGMDNTPENQLTIYHELYHIVDRLHKDISLDKKSSFYIVHSELGLRETFTDEYGRSKLDLAGAELKLFLPHEMLADIFATAMYNRINAGVPGGKDLRVHSYYIPTGKLTTDLADFFSEQENMLSLLEAADQGSVLALAGLLGEAVLSSETVRSAEDRFADWQLRWDIEIGPEHEARTELIEMLIRENYASYFSADFRPVFQQSFTAFRDYLLTAEIPEKKKQMIILGLALIQQWQEYMYYNLGDLFGIEYTE